MPMGLWLESPFLLDFDVPRILLHAKEDHSVLFPKMAVLLFPQLKRVPVFLFL